MKLISARTFREAEIIAYENGLKRWEWKYIPWEPSDVRRQELCGRKAKREDLIGYFSSTEVFFLVERFETKKEEKAPLIR